MWRVSMVKSNGVVRVEPNYLHLRREQLTVFATLIIIVIIINIATIIYIYSSWLSQNAAIIAATAAAKSLQSCLTLCDPRDGSPPGPPVPGILQARTLEWVAISFSNAWKWKVKVKSLSHVWLPATPWTAAHQAPPSMGFSRQEYWSGVPLPSPARVLLGSNSFQFVTEELMLLFIIPLPNLEKRSFGAQADKQPTQAKDYFKKRRPCL